MRRILFLVLMLSSVGAWAEEYYWQVRPSGNYSGNYPSADAACKSLGNYHAKMTSESTADCGKINHSNDFVRVAFARRVGDRCAEGTEYNPATGSCDQDCSETSGQGTTHLFLGASRTSAETPFPNPIENSPPRHICAGSCRYRENSGAEMTCGPLTGSDLLGLYCIALYTGEGEKCQSGDNPQQGSGGSIGGPEPVPPTDPDDPTDPANNCGPTHVWSGSTCTPIFAPDPADPGNGGDNGGNNGGGGGNNGGGSGDGGGNGDGDGDGNGDGSGNGSGGGGGGGGCGAGSCPDGGGDGEPHDWYVPGESTFGDVLSEFNQRMNSAPIISQTSQFFDINVGGSCPVWSVNAWVFQVVIDQHCTANIPWDLIRGVLIACASFVAFRWAFL